MLTTTPRLVVAGVTSGVGKTTFAAGIIGALRARGLRVQPYKCGPDYIDPSHLTRAAGVPTCNLDSWMLPHPVLQELFARASLQADVAIIEGMMGLFDGRSGEGETGSTAQIAKLLGAPVVLVIDVGKVGRSAAATVAGFQRFDPDLHLAGVILNQVGSDWHRQIVTEAIVAATGLPVLGALPRNDTLKREERYLGLVPDAEASPEEQRGDRLVEEVAARCDLDALMALAQQATPLHTQETGVFPAEPVEPGTRIAVAQDRAFSFYYQDNLDLLHAWGAELVPFSPLEDDSLPPGCHGLYIGGGFPELYARQLAVNTAMQAAVSRAARSGMPVLAECGGLMYLAEGISDFEGTRHAMVGLAPGTCVMHRQRARLGYLTVRALRDTLLLPRGESVRAHEFHWSRMESGHPQESTAFQVEGQPQRQEGFAEGNILASYVHIHFGARLDLAPRFVRACRAWACLPDRQARNS